MPKKKVKKGPKGKKARRAAKLDRQWGEEANEEEIKKAKIRKGKRRLHPNDDGEHGKSRIVSKKKFRPDAMKEEEEVAVGYVDDDGSEVSSSDASSVESEGEGEDEDNGIGDYESNSEFALSSLMDNINNVGKSRKKSWKQNKLSNADMNGEESSIEESSDDESNGSEDDINDHDSDDDNENELSDDNDDDDGEEKEKGDEDDDKDNRNALNNIITSLKPIGPNPFHSHFDKEPFPEKGAMEISPHLLQMKRGKNIERSLNPNLILQLSGKALEVNTTAATTTTTGDNNDDETMMTTTTKSNNTVSTSQKSFSHIQKILLSNWNRINRKSLRKNIDANDDVDDKHKNMNHTKLLSSLQDCIYGPISTYSDALITCVTRKNRDAINNILMLHIMNHILTANHEITTNNNHIRNMKDEHGEDIDPDKEKEWRDQGYTRPKVLVLLPTRSTAHSFVTNITELIGADGDNATTKPSSLSIVENLDRFNGEFGNSEENSELDERLKRVVEAKGKDYNELFANHINSDDDFKIGISFAKKKVKKTKSKKKGGNNDGLNMKIYSDFYHSDIILASPLGLKMSITDDEEEENDADFLSSIEIVASLQSDVMLMQNWDHILALMGRINQQPKKSNRTDFSRVRNYLLLGQAARWRQFIMVSRFSDPHLVSTFSRHAKSFAGRMKLRRKVPADEASICNVITRVRQVFQRVPCESFATQGDKRIKYFTSVLLPQLLRTKQKHTLLYIPSYFDFVALRNILLKHDVASHHFVSITEYSRGTEVTRGRGRFLQGHKRLMLYTGRAHFFMRHHIKGAKHIIMFGLPEHAEFYPELLSFLAWRPPAENEDEEYQLDMSAPASCLNLFTKYEAHSLERIVGTKHSERMVKGDKKTFLFNS